MNQQYRDWRKTTHSTPDGDCVEVSRTIDATGENGRPADRPAEA